MTLLSLSFRGLSFANFRNEYQMTFLVIDHESGFKALHSNDSSKKENQDTESLRFVLIIIIVIDIMTLEYSKPSNDRRALCRLKLKIINHIFSVIISKNKCYGLICVFHPQFMLKP